MASINLESSLDRRLGDADKQAHWDKMSLAQKFVASELGRFGYDLAFVRTTATGPLAVLRLDETHATIDFEGDVDMNPSVVIR